MLELLTQYSLSKILIFLIFIILAIKEGIILFDFFKGKITDIYHKVRNKENNATNLDSQINNIKSDKEKMQEDIDNIKEQMSDIMNKIQMLIESDRDDIKSDIVEKHHYFCYEIKWIDDYSLDCLEKRFTHYKAEGGNSFIKDLMNEIRSLPKQPPQE